jgi:hypothetical protein
MRIFGQRVGASIPSEGEDLRQRRTVLQAELETLSVQRERTALASSFERSRQHAGVTPSDESELGRLATERSNDEDAIRDLRRQIASLDEALGRDRSGGLQGKGRRIVGRLRV